ncbi:cupin domain-containing protein [Massilia antarctica]|uniref:cupin domain-containing protein n=1 Tax=Massilia antarctica TaxID=2765360 RepID=UPI0006BB92AD|nr:cupin domain-containing protein [Massilia sp. H27-R4]MCY0911669.1 cupin domain-containing protein [Massilia sp. H27-R4]CUI04658.1 rhamnogalacturonan acetylesterase [Janthinobacterium sp. CG23_2]CUU28444.1 rhamnogalacturonan acetylesterase [Janthinobacterium sp. CG23_2]
MMLAMLLMAAGPAMVIVREDDVKRDEAPPHGAIGMSTAYRVSDAAPAPRSMEFRKRVLHPGAAIGVHRIAHDEVYYVLAGEGEVSSDGVTERLAPGMAAYLYKGAQVGIRQVGAQALSIIVSYPNPPR